MQRLDVSLEAKSFSEADGAYLLEGYASVFGNTDLDGDVMAKGAFTDTLKTRDPVLLWGHDMGSVPIGKVMSVSEDSKGLRFSAQMPKDDDRVKGQIAPQLRLGSLKGVSIGFRVKDRERQKDGTTLLKRVELYEISLVSIPANPMASVTGFKSLGVLTFNDDLPLADRKRKWSEEAALERIKAHFDVDTYATPDYREAFLFHDPDSPDDLSSCKFCICDVVDGKLTAVPSAIYKATAALMKTKDSELDSEVRAALQKTLDRYYARLDPSSSTKCFSISEWEHLEAGEREARLRALGLSGGLAKTLSSGPRDADRPHRDGGMSEVLKGLQAIQELVNKDQ
jgi:HK97 family phage prohead protease